MSTEIIDMLVEGGKAVAGPAVGQKLGPLKINIADVLKKINEKTESFKGMKVPIKLSVNTETKEFNIEVGLPPVSELIKSELKIEKGSGIPDKYKVANISIEQVIKIANMKKEGMYTDRLKSAVKSVIGSCNSLGVLIESKKAPEIIKKVNEGRYDKEINENITTPSQEKLSKLAEDLKVSQAEGQKYIDKIEAEKAAKEEAKVAPKEESKKDEKTTATKNKK